MLLTLFRRHRGFAGRPSELLSLSPVTIGRLLSLSPVGTSELLSLSPVTIVPPPPRLGIHVAPMPTLLISQNVGSQMDPIRGDPLYLWRAARYLPQKKTTLTPRPQMDPTTYSETTAIFLKKNSFRTPPKWTPSGMTPLSLSPVAICYYCYYYQIRCCCFLYIWGRRWCNIV